MLEALDTTHNRLVRGLSIINNIEIPSKQLQTNETTFKMPFKLTEMNPSEMTANGAFKDLITAQWESYENPYTRLLNLFFPIKGPGPEAHALRIQESMLRQLHEHEKSSPSSRWLKVIDTETGEIAGGAQWFVFEENPYASGEGDGDGDGILDCWDEGEDREFAEALLGQFLASRMSWMQRPHMHLEACFTRPKYRRQGVGKLLMNWGIQKADELGFETYIDASELGALLYKNYGFLNPGWVDVKAPVNEKPSARFKVLEDVLLPLTFLPQWRPVEGKLDESTRKPWEITA